MPVGRKGKSSRPRGVPPEVAQLLAYAGEDLAAARDLARNPDRADRIVGFHSQQCVEKALKAVLAGSGEGYEQVHDVAVLIEHLRGLPRLDVPAVVEEADWLTPWAVRERYPRASAAAPARLDRDRALGTAGAVLTWAAESAVPPR